MDFSTKRRLAVYLRYAQPAVDLVGIVILLAFFFTLTPNEIFNSNPATGGDTGSHFWPLVTLVKHGLPNGLLRVWNPGNLGGEPHLVHYFPLPYLLMAGLSAFIPLGMAFNVGTLIPTCFFPFASYVAVRGAGFRFPAPIIAAAFSTAFLYCESYSMWGGNTLSTLAGQFAHAYGLFFLLLGVGALGWELTRNFPPLLSSILFSFACLSHSYAYLGVPLFSLAFLLFPLAKGSKLNFNKRFSKVFLSNLLSIILALWYLVPMVTNSKWTTAFYVTWHSGKLMEELSPSMFTPGVASITKWVEVSCLTPKGSANFLQKTLVLSWCKDPSQLKTSDQPPNAKPQRVYEFVATAEILLIFSAAWLCFRRRKIGFFFWGIPILGYLFFYLVFPYVGLVDVRALPQIQLFYTLLLGTAVAEAIRKLGALTSWLLTLPILIGVNWWVLSNVAQYPNWIIWNYSGWESKPLSLSLKNLSEHIAGTFSEPRVISEHNDINSKSGTIRVFEMLPYFTGRATLESAYLQASVLAPEAFDLQADISKTPSCPFIQYKCHSYDLEKARGRLELMSVGTLILSSPELLEQASKATFLIPDQVFGPWHLYKLKNQPSLVTVLAQRPVPIVAKDFKQEFHSWFRNYTGVEPLLLNKQFLDDDVRERIETAPLDDGSCAPTVKVTFNEIELKTDCPGKIHALHFAYHGTWKSDNGDKIFMLSPGFIGIVPSTEVVRLRFGQSMLWSISGWISAAAWITTLMYGLITIRKFRI